MIMMIIMRMMRMMKMMISQSLAYDRNPGDARVNVGSGRKFASHSDECKPTSTRIDNLTLRVCVSVFVCVCGCV